MSSSSDEDIPLALKKTLKPAAAAENAPSKVKKAAPIDDDDSSSDEDVPLAQKQTKKKVPVKSPPSAAPKKKAPASAAKKVAPKKKPAPAPAKSTASKGASSGTERVKRVFDMPGQTRDTPDEDDALRKFYTSLLEQKPESEMARRWCAMTGLLSKEEAEKWVKEQARKKGTKSPTKPAARRPAATAGAGSSKRKKAAASDDDDDEEAFKSAKKAKPSKKKEVAAPKPKKEKKKPVAEKKPNKKKEAESESEAWDSSDNEEIIPKAKKRGDKSAVKSPAAPKSAVKKKTTRDVAFNDGGMDAGSESSDDDVPLLQRKKA